jgi:aprataxin
MSWSNGLLKYCLKPTEHPEQVVLVTADVVAIKDVYPKSKNHFLIMPRAQLTMKQLRRTHVPLLRSMKSCVDQIITTETPKAYKVGFHSIPSMNQLHLHVISTDFVSPCLKNKKHYNSFCTPFFIEIDQAIKQLNDEDELSFDTNKFEAYLKEPLQCLHCDSVFTNIPKLKQHLETHL